MNPINTNNTQKISLVPGKWQCANKGKEEETEKEGYLRKERSFMRYYREIPLPEGATEEGANAQLKNGVLTVTLPKTKLVAGKRIQIE